MKSRQIILIAAGCLVALFVFLMVHRKHEPEYDGRKLSEWLAGYYDPDGDRERIEKAVQAIGTNALPWLINWVRWEEPRWKPKARVAVSKLPVEVDRLEEGLQSKWTTTHPHYLARAGFAMLRRRAAPAFADLKRLSLDSTTNPANRDLALDCAFLVDPMALSSDPVWKRQILRIDPALEKYFRNF